MSSPATGRSIEDRLAAAGLGALPRLAWLEIDLDAVRTNLATIRRLAGAGVPVHPVVKADAYGHGALPVAKPLEAAGADGFCVAAYDEAAALRDGGIQRPILVLFPIPATWAPTAARRRVSVTVGDLDHLDALIAAMTTALPRPRTALRTQLEVETGLGRGGLLPNDVSEAAERIAASPGVRLEGLWTHLQAAEDPARTAAQIRLFEEASGALGRAGIRLPARHVAASVALLGDDVAAYDGIRPGLSIYGLLPDELAGQFDAGKEPGFQPVMSLHARPVRVADLPAGWGISYGPTFQAARPSRIATLPLGYGDGWPRSLSNRAAALVRGTRVPLVGNVAMDAVMADVTDVPGRPVTTNDEFVLLGRQGAEAITAAELARLRTTNQWEIVTSMARRLPRVYHARSGPEGVRTLVSGGLG